MAIYQTKGLVIKVKDVGEADRLLSILTETQGKVVVRAKGVRWFYSKNHGHLDLLSYLRLTLVEGRQMDQVTSVETIDSFKPIKDNLQKTAFAYYLLELCDKLLPEKEENKNVLALLLAVLEVLKKEKPQKPLLLFFQLNLLTLLGFQPQLSFCVNCQRRFSPKEIWFFSPTMGGLLCHLCRKNDPQAEPLSLKEWQTLQFLLSKRLKEVLSFPWDEKTGQRLEELLKVFLRSLSAREFRAPRFIQKVEEC